MDVLIRIDDFDRLVSTPSLDKFECPGGKFQGSVCYVRWICIILVVFIYKFLVFDYSTGRGTFELCLKRNSTGRLHIPIRSSVISYNLPNSNHIRRMCSGRSWDAICSVRSIVLNQSDVHHATFVLRYRWRQSWHGARKSTKRSSYCLRKSAKKAAHTADRRWSDSKQIVESDVRSFA
jgi:hypothetical protein